MKRELFPFPRDVIEKITNDLSPEDFVKFCSLEENKKLCDNDQVWARRMQKDFNFLIPYIDMRKAKNSYLQILTLISESAMRIAEKVLDSFGDFRKYLTSDYKKDVYNVSFDQLRENLKLVIKTNDIYETLNVIGKLYPLIPPLARDYDDYWGEIIGDEVATFNETMLRFLNIPFEEITPIGSPPDSSPLGSPRLV